MMHELLKTIFLPAFDNPALRQGNDGAILEMPAGRIALATDSHVVRPLSFPGGSIGSLAIHGTVNDLAMVGAWPIALAAAFIIQEGLPFAVLQGIVNDMREAAESVGVPIVTGDTKVVEHESCDGVFITTTGLGIVPPGIVLDGASAQPGDVVVLSGPVGNHGIAVASQRDGMAFATPVSSDTRALHRLVEAMLKAAPGLRALRDPTRGGLATTLNELASQSGLAMEIEEERIPVDAAVRGACSMLGFDPLYLANEGVLIAIVPEDQTESLLHCMKTREESPSAAIIGRVVKGRPGMVTLNTGIGGRRILPMLAGEILPRIC